MKIKKGNKEFVFDQKVSRNGNGGYLIAIKFKRKIKRKLKTKAQRKSMMLQKNEQKFKLIFYMKNWGIHPKRW